MKITVPLEDEIGPLPSEVAKDISMLEKAKALSAQEAVRAKSSELKECLELEKAFKQSLASNDTRNEEDIWLEKALLLSKLESNSRSLQSKGLSDPDDTHDKSNEEDEFALAIKLSLELSYNAKTIPIDDSIESNPEPLQSENRSDPGLAKSYNEDDHLYESNHDISEEDELTWAIKQSLELSQNMKTISIDDSIEEAYKQSMILQNDCVDTERREIEEALSAVENFKLKHII